MQATNKQLAIYLAVAFGVAWACQAVAIAYQGSVPIFQSALALSMFAPLLGVIVACKGPSEKRSGVRWSPLIKGRVRLLLAALFVPALLTLVGAAVVFGLFPDQLDLGMSFIAVQVESVGVPVSDGMVGGVPFAAIMAVQAAQAVIIAPFINMFLAVGEESGWRGFMTPAFQQRLGYRMGVVVSGVVWGAWHWPVIVFAGYEYGRGYWGEPVSGMLLFCLFTVAAGIMLSLLYEKAGSIWYPALAHGAINSVGSLPMFVMSADVTSYFNSPLLVGIIPVLICVAVAVLLLVRFKGASPTIDGSVVS